MPDMEKQVAPPTTNEWQRDASLTLTLTVKYPRSLLIIFYVRLCVLVMTANFTISRWSVIDAFRASKDETYLVTLTQDGAKGAGW